MSSIWIVQGGAARVGRALTVLVAVLLLSGCAGRDVQPLASPDPNAYSGPLMGFHEMVSSAYLDNTSKSRVRLIAARPADPYNVEVVRARVVPVHIDGDPHAEGLWGAFRWPRSDVDDEIRRLFDRERPVKDFVVPAGSTAEWMVALQYRQRDRAKSMRIAGVILDYAVGPDRREIRLSDAFCFTTPTDRRACSAYS